MIKSFANIEEAIDLVNSRPKALSAYIFARNNKIVDQFKCQTSAGSFVVNESVLQFGHPSMPFGGVNNSGIGKSHGEHRFLAFSNQKSVLKQRGRYYHGQNALSTVQLLQADEHRFSIKIFLT